MTTLEIKKDIIRWAIEEEASYDDIVREFHVEGITDLDIIENTYSEIEDIRDEMEYQREEELKELEYLYKEWQLERAQELSDYYRAVS